jgi:hypothetical protein
MKQILEWAGILYEEGPDKNGPYGPYIQVISCYIYRCSMF